MTIPTPVLALFSNIQQSTNQSAGIKIAGLDSSNIGQALDNQKRIINIAKLHNAPTAKQNELVNTHNMMACVATVLDPPRYGNLGIGSVISCTDQVTDMIVNHELGNNQSMISLAREYLKSQGIQ